MEKKSMTTRAILWARSPSQMTALRNAAARRGYTVVEESQTGGVPELTAKARRSAYDVLVITALDELLEGDELVEERTVDTIITVKQLESAGITIVSLREPWLASTELKGETGLPQLRSVRELLLVYSVFVFQQEKQEALEQAEWERAARSERAKAGLSQARVEGRSIGRPSLTNTVDLGFVEANKKRGLSWAAIARIHPRTIRTAQGGSRRPSSHTIRKAWENATG